MVEKPGIKIIDFDDFVFFTTESKSIILMPGFSQKTTPRCDEINQIAWEDEIPQYLQDMLQAVAACLADRHTPNTRQTLQLILRTVQTQYMEELSLIDFSQKYHLNYIYLSRKFKDMVGLTFTEYLLQIRMNKAKELIEENGMSEKAGSRGSRQIKARVWF